MADEKQIRQACSNLIKNSYENIILNNVSNGKFQSLLKTRMILLQLQ